jgi:hypothetical protein
MLGPARPHMAWLARPVSPRQSPEGPASRWLLGGGCVRLVMECVQIKVAPAHRGSSSGAISEPQDAVSCSGAMGCKAPRQRWRLRQRRHRRVCKLQNLQERSGPNPTRVARYGLRCLDEVVAEIVQCGDPDFHQLEPDVELAKPAPCAPTSRIVQRAEFTNHFGLVGPALSSVRASRF